MTAHDTKTGEAIERAIETLYSNGYPTDVIEAARAELRDYRRRAIALRDYPVDKANAGGVASGDDQPTPLRSDTFDFLGVSVEAPPGCGKRGQGIPSTPVTALEFMYRTDAEGLFCGLYSVGSLLREYASTGDVAHINEALQCVARALGGAASIGRKSHTYKRLEQLEILLSQERDGDGRGPEYITNAHKATVGDLCIDLSKCMVFVVRDAEVEGLEMESHRPFGQQVYTVFPKAADDIDEARWCLAASRWTGCVMHLMRALDSVLAKMAGTTKAPPTNNGWKSVITSIKNEMDKQRKALRAAARASKAAGDMEKREKYLARAKVFTAALGRLDGIREVIRNEAFHKPVIYRTREAHDIYLATKSFMSYLAANYYRSK